jgi:hypothetical protein
VLVLYIGYLLCVYGRPVYMVEFWESSTQIPIVLGLLISSGSIIGAETLELASSRAITTVLRSTILATPSS